MLGAEYKCGSEFIPNINSCINGSQLWFGVVKNWDNIVHNLERNLGNGRGVNSSETGLLTLSILSLTNICCLKFFTVDEQDQEE